MDTKILHLTIDNAKKKGTSSSFVVLSLIDRVHAGCLAVTLEMYANKLKGVGHPRYHEIDKFLFPLSLSLAGMSIID